MHSTVNGMNFIKFCLSNMIESYGSLLLFTVHTFSTVFLSIFCTDVYAFLFFVDTRHECISHEKCAAGNCFVMKY